MSVAVTVGKATHTQGPWHRNIRSDGKYPIIFSGRNNHIAVAKPQETGAETEANIDLIAAAPELLAILERIMRPPIITQQLKPTTMKSMRFARSP